jgi:peptide/nickel transport system ATP-binding protein
VLLVSDDGAAGGEVLEVLNLNISVFAGGRWQPAVTDVSLSVHSGEMVGLVGESGSGKSLTGMAVMGLLDTGAVRTSGLILVNGQVFAGPDRQELHKGRRAGLAMVFQNPMTSLNPAMRVGWQVAEALRVHEPGLSRRAAWLRAVELLDLVKLGAARRVARQYPHQLSGGMQQRVMIAIALACKPRVLIADEPTTALDATVQQSIMILLHEIRAEFGLGILLISHNLPLVARRCDRLLAMYAGELVEVGSAAEVFDGPRHPYVHGLLECTPEFALQTGSLRSLEGRVPGPSEWNDDACRFAPRCAFVATKCHSSHPSITSIGSERWVRCLRSDELGAAFSARPEIAGSGELEVGAQISVATGVSRREGTASEPLISVSGATKVYRSRSPHDGSRVVAVDHVDLHISEGESVGLVGESGSGKSTLGWIMSGLLKPDSGLVRLGGQEVYGRRGVGKSVRRAVQMVFQDPYSSLNPAMRVGAIIQEPLMRLRNQTAKLARQNAGDLLERVGLDHRLAMVRPASLSGGQRQRVSIARAIAARPKLIICDESVSALDVSVQSQILSLLKELRDETGVSYLFISHDIAVVCLVASRVAVMSEGRVVEECSAAQLSSGAVQDNVTQHLLSALPRV